MALKRQQCPSSSYLKIVLLHFTLLFEAYFPVDLHRRADDTSIFPLLQLIESMWNRQECCLEDIACVAGPWISWTPGFCGWATPMLRGYDCRSSEDLPSSCLVVLPVVSEWVVSTIKISRPPRFSGVHCMWAEQGAQYAQCHLLNPKCPLVIY